MVMFCYFIFFFFFKQKTAYEMRISDWSSDVCSSDLKAGMPQGPDTWNDVLEIGAQIRDKQGVKVGIGMSQELDSNMAARSILWAWDAPLQDEGDNVLLDPGLFKRRAVEAVQYMQEV